MNNSKLLKKLAVFSAVFCFTGPVVTFGAGYPPPVPGDPNMAQGFPGGGMPPQGAPQGQGFPGGGMPPQGQGFPGGGPQGQFPGAPQGDPNAMQGFPGGGPQGPGFSPQAGMPGGM